MMSLTLNEAGYVVQQPAAAINRAVDRGVIKAELQRRGRARLRKVGAAELRYLAIAGHVDKDLTPTGRRKVYEALRRLPAEASSVDLGVMQLKLADIDRHLDARLVQLAQIKALVDDSKPGEPVLRGTRTPVHAVAALATTETTLEIIEDHPGLTPDQVEAAVEYAKIYPRTGRPPPTRSFKRMLSDGAAAGIWDVENDPEPVTPQRIP